MATHSSILAWRTPWIEEPGGLQSVGHKELDMTEQQRTYTTQKQDLCFLPTSNGLCFLQAKVCLSYKQWFVLITILTTRICKKAKWLSEGALQKSEKRSEPKGKVGKIHPSECRVPKNTKER